jgi:glycosyltransferase involved in cell wall biosynthesis
MTIGNSSVKDTLLKQVPDIERHTRLVTVPHGVNLDNFRLIDRQRGKNLAYAGYPNMTSNPMLLLQCMQKLHYIDPEYKLFFAGVFQDPMLEQYAKHMLRELDLADVVFFDPPMPEQRDVNAWLQDKHYIVSCSIGESRGTGLLEGMACGLKPVIHNFAGAGEIFPSEFLFNISEEFCQQILCDRYEPERYRKFVEENYALKEQLDRVNGVFKQLEAEIDLQLSDAATSGSLLSVRPADVALSPEPGTFVFEDRAGENHGIV